MRKLLSIGLLFSYTHLYAINAAIDIGKVRVLYEKSVTDKKACKEMTELLSEIDENEPLLLGYKASATMVMANYKINPLSKLSYFNRGKRMLELAIEADSENPELRLLRLMIQVNSPSFLGYNSKIESDKSVILSNASTMTDIKSKEFVIKNLMKLKYNNSIGKVN